MFTCTAPIVLWLLAYIPLPGIDGELTKSLMAAGASTRVDHSIVTLGIVPIVSGYVWVELAAVLVPGWRSLRIGGRSGRARLRRATNFLIVLFASIQGWVIAINMEHFEIAGLALVKFPGAPFRLVVVLTLVTTTLLLTWYADLIDRFGLGGGLSVLVGAHCLFDLADIGGSIAAVSVDGVPINHVLLFAVFAATVGLTWRIGAAGGSTIRAPASGLAPITTAMTSLAIPATLVYFLPDFEPLAARLSPGTDLHSVLFVGFTAALGVFFSWLFNQPERVAAIDSTASSRLGEARLRTGVYLVTIVIAWVVAINASEGLIAIDLMTLAVFTAIVGDLRFEWVARTQRPKVVRVWPVHRVYGVEPALQALSEAGIWAFPRGLRHRTLLQFFGPYVPIEILVPEDRGAEATRLLRELLLPQGHETEDRDSA